MISEMVDGGHLRSGTERCQRQKNTNEETLVREISVLQDDLCASFAADNGALQIGWPTGVCPGSRQEEISNGTALKGPPDFCARW